MVLIDYSFFHSNTHLHAGQILQESFSDFKKLNYDFANEEDILI